MKNSKVGFVKNLTKMLFAQILLVVVGAVPLQATAADSPFWKPCTKLGSKTNYSISGVKGVLTCKKRGPFAGEAKGKWTMYWTEAGSKSAGPKILANVQNTTTTVQNTTTTVQNTTTTVQNTTTTTATFTKPLISNLGYSTTIRPGTLLTVAFTVTSITGINKNAYVGVTFRHEGGGGYFAESFGEGLKNPCFRASDSILNCEGTVQFSETAAAGTYRLIIIGFISPNNVSLNFNQFKALTVAT